MPQESSGSTKKVIKSGIVKDAGILMAALLLVLECFWFYKLYAGTADWFQAPLPDYQMIMEGIHFLRVIICIICLIGFFKPMYTLWVIFKYMIFVYQCVVVSFTTVYWVRYGYTVGAGLDDALMILSGMPLLFILFLMLGRRKGMKRTAVCGVIVADLLFYFLGEWFYSDITIFNLFFPYHGFLLKSVLATVLITYICCFGNLDAEG